MNRFKILAFAGLLAVTLSGCTTMAQFAAEIAQSTSSGTPSQVTTLAEAEQAATLATQAADIAVNTGKLDRGTLQEIKTLSDSLHAALGVLQSANASGQSLDYSSFNAALAAYNAYMTSQGISH